VQEVEVDVIGLQSLELLVEEPVKVLWGFDLPTG